MAAALKIAEHRRVVVIARELPVHHRPPRFESVSPQVLQLLMELGVSPENVTTNGYAGERLVAWSTNEPKASSGPPVAFIERPRLENQMFAQLLSTRDAAINIDRARPVFDRGWFAGNGWQAPAIIDATGVAAAFAGKRNQPARGWLARIWQLATTGNTKPAIRLASLPAGYAYVLAADDAATVGFVGAAAAVRQPLHRLIEIIRAGGAGWLLDGLSCDSTARHSWTGRGHTIWTEPAETLPVLSIGDAALARDPLSSQGLGAALGDALAAAAVDSADDVHLFRLRQRAQTASHLRLVRQMLTESQWAQSPVWRGYADALQQPAIADRKIGLRAGRLCALG